MRITSFSVTRLFGMFNHTVQLNQSEKITIVYGPNGFGKTYLLKAVNDLFNVNFDDLAEAPFAGLTVLLDDGRRIALERNDWDGSGISSITVTEKNGGSRALSREEFARMVSNTVSVRFINAERLMQYSDYERDRPVIMICAEQMKKILADDPDETVRQKIDEFTRIVNSRFLHKKLVIDSDHGFLIRTATDTILRPEQLSSGEQHAVIILFELLFTVERNTLMLIDEPELSLHILWQQQFIRDIETILRFVDFDVVIATHSPQIIHDRWDLTVELRGPEE